MEKVKMDVQFRMSNDEVIAVFPYEIQGTDFVGCYAHDGQHSVCRWDINQSTKQATAKQYEPLKRELESIGYIVNVVKRRNHTRYLKTLYSEKVKRYNLQFN